MASIDEQPDEVEPADVSEPTGGDASTSAGQVNLSWRRCNVVLGAGFRRILPVVA